MVNAQRLHAIAKGLAVAKVSSSHASRLRLNLSLGTQVFQGFKPDNQRLNRLLVGLDLDFHNGILKRTVKPRHAAYEQTEIRHFYEYSLTQKLFFIQLNFRKLLIYIDFTKPMNKGKYKNVRIVIPVVVGSSLISHPPICKKPRYFSGGVFFILPTAGKLKTLCL